MLGSLHEPRGVGDGVLQLLLPLLQMGKFLLDLDLLLGVLGREDAVLLIWDPAKHIILIESFEQGGQLCLPAAQLVQLLLDLADLLLRLGRVPLCHMAQKKIFLLPCKLCTRRRSSSTMAFS